MKINFEELVGQVLIRQELVGSASKGRPAGRGLTLNGYELQQQQHQEEISLVLHWEPYDRDFFGDSSL